MRNACLILAACGAIAPAAAAPVAFTRMARHASTADGIVRISGAGRGVVSVGADLDAAGPVRIAMEVRRTTISEAVPDRHFGFQILGGDGLRAHVYTRGTGFIAALHRGTAKLAETGARGGANLFPAEAEAPWVPVEIRVRPRMTELYAGGALQATVAADLLPLKALEAYAYHTNVEIRSVSIDPLPQAQSVSADPRPSFHASFDAGLSAATPDGGLAPSISRGAVLVPGVSGRAVRIAADGPSKNPALEYPIKGLVADHGTAMFWMRSDWDGPFTGQIPTYPMLAGYDASGAERMNIFMYFWISFRLPRVAPLKSEEMKRERRSDWYRGDWNHVAMVWSDGGWCKAYVNGLPYQQPFGFPGKIVADLDMKALVRLSIGSGPRAAAEFDELKIYRRPLDDGEVYDQYRAVMPVDLLVDRTVVAAGGRDEVVLSAAPGGFYMRPVPGTRPPVAGRFRIGLSLAAEDGTIVARKDFTPRLAGPTDLRMPVSGLAPGKYRLLCAVGPVQRTFMLTAYTPQAAAPASDDGIRTGPVIFSKDLRDGAVLDSGGIRTVESPAGTYIEAGARKENKFAFEVPFPAEFLHGRPVMLEIDWPDDKPRSMGLYMYPESKGAQHRDRLGGGIQSGVEFPLSGAMRTARYLFHPVLGRYLFEARTMINGYPAAIAGFRVRGILDERLPRLAVRPPDGLPQRRFGYRDEDESFDQNLGAWDGSGKGVQAVTERLLDYLDYTGQNAWQYPFMRYNGYNFPMEGVLHSLYPYRAEAFRYMVDAMAFRGKTVIAGIDLYTIPELQMLPWETDAHVSRGWTISRYDAPTVRPGSRPRPNHANPEVRAMIVRHVAETARRFARAPGFDGIAMTTAIGFYSSLEEGYDEFTVGRFRRETGVAVPAKDGPGRYAFLTAEPRRAAWVAWRNRQTTLLFREIRAALDRAAPGLPLYINIPLAAPSPDRDALLADLRAIKGVRLAPLRFCTAHRHRLHWGKPADDYNDILYDRAVAASLMNGRLGYADSFPTYFESFNGSLKNDVYASYFQNADVKPHGRYFLKELSFTVAAMDSQRILIGAQPLGTWGRDDEAREFAKAYCALPALPFADAPGRRDPVTVRFLNTARGTYVYAVSMLWDDCEATLALPPGAALEDRSTGETVRDGRVRLRAFELRTFLSPDPRLKVAGAAVAVPARVNEYCRVELDRRRKAVETLTAAGIASADASAALSRAAASLDAGGYAEFHRLLFSLPVAETLEKAGNLPSFREQAAMIAKGRYAVNCGALGFYRARNGTLFFPDRPLAAGDYGYVGGYQSVARDIEGLAADDPELFATEAYAVDAYRFRAPPGRYRVRLYMKAGYLRGFKNDTFVFNVSIQGKPVLRDFDVVAACGNDFKRAVVTEFGGVEPASGFIEIGFATDGRHDPTAKLINAIEIVPE